jgi:hypothetical protein
VHPDDDPVPLSSLPVPPACSSSFVFSRGKGRDMKEGREEGRKEGRKEEKEGKAHRKILRTPRSKRYQRDRQSDPGQQHYNRLRTGLPAKTGPPHNRPPRLR